MRKVAGYIAEEGPKPTWLATHTEPIVKASLSFLAKFWWPIGRSCIRSMLTDNTLTEECAILVASSLARYDIDWVFLIAEKIHKASL